MKTIKHTYHINAPIEAVWEALVDPSVINNWGGGKAEMDDKEGTEFSLWGGDIHGKNIKVVQGKKLVQEWFSDDWDKASIVTFTLHSKDASTSVDLLHKDVPDNAAKDIEEGWKDYYMGPLKEYVEKS